MEATGLICHVARIQENKEIEAAAFPSALLAATSHNQ